ncbi:MAG: hypothetical protein ABW036_04555, partial [Flavitalea sp.]
MTKSDNPLQDQNKGMHTFDLDMNNISDNETLQQIFNDKVKEMVDEKTKILAFSNLIASAPNKQILGKIIGQHLEDFFGIYEYCIYINSRDGKWSWPFIFNGDTAIAQQQIFQDWIETPLDLNDELHKVGKSLTDVLLLDKEQYLALPGMEVY